MDIKDIEQYIKALFPYQELMKLPEGGMSYAYEINDKIIRIPKTQYAKSGYEMENAILDYLHKNISCTKLPYIQIIRDPFFYTIHEKIPGIYWNEQTYLSKDEKTRDSLAEDCAVFFAQLHSSNLAQIKTELLGLHPIQKNMETYLNEYFSHSEMQAIVDFTNPLFSLGDKVLVHRDFYSDNFLLTHSYRLNGVIDFGNSGVYNYMFDFKALASWEDGMRDFFTRISARYARITGRIINTRTIHRIDIHNYISFLVYFVKNKNIKDEKNGAVSLWEHANHIKEKMKRYV